VPRLLLFWMTTEALRNKSKENPRRLELGNSLSEFMREIGLNPDNGGMGAKRSDARRLRDQMERLFRARISFEADFEKDGRAGDAIMNMVVASKAMMWWSEENPHQTTLWGSWVELGEDFYKAITAAPVPVDVVVGGHLPTGIAADNLVHRVTFTGIAQVAGVGQAVVSPAAI
jgi:hypothetical protein